LAVTFADTAGFDRATFAENASFNGATFSSSARFYRTTFKGNANFAQTTFAREVVFGETTFEALVDFDGCTFAHPPWIAEVNVLGVGNEWLDHYRVWPDGWIVQPDTDDPTHGTLVRVQ